MVTTLDRFVKAQIEMADAHNQEGRISHAINAQEFPGAYGDMARNLNEMVQSHIDVQMQFIDCMVGYIHANFEHRGEAARRAAENFRHGRKDSSRTEAANAAQFNAQIKAALDSASACVMMADTQGVIRYQNKANEALM